MTPLEGFGLGGVTAFALFMLLPAGIRELRHWWHDRSHLTDREQQIIDKLAPLNSGRRPR